MERPEPTVVRKPSVSNTADAFLPPVLLRAFGAVAFRFCFAGICSPVSTLTVENGGLSRSGQFKVEQPAASLRLTVGRSTWGTTMDRNPKASLSPREINVLRALKLPSDRVFSSEDLRLLLSMGLVVEDGATIALSPAGRALLEQEERANL